MTIKDVLADKLGFGAAPLGNMFRDIPEDEALATVEAAWEGWHPLLRQRPLLRCRTRRTQDGRSPRRASRAMHT